MPSASSCSASRTCEAPQRFDLATRRETHVTHFTWQAVRDFAISPDGRWIVYPRGPETYHPWDRTRPALWIIGVDGRHEHLLVESGRCRPVADSICGGGVTFAPGGPIRVRCEKEVIMSFLDKVGRVVGEAVDKGRKDVEQFVKIQKINGEIGGIEKRMAEIEREIAQAKQAAGEKAIQLVRTAAIVSPALQSFADQVQGFEVRIDTERAAIAARQADIERIRAEHAAEHQAAAR